VLVIDSSLVAMTSMKTVDWDGKTTVIAERDVKVDVSAYGSISRVLLSFGAPTGAAGTAVTIMELTGAEAKSLGELLLRAGSLK
jgi:hypothetical protein